MAFTEFFAKKKTCDFVVNLDGAVTKKYNYFREFLEFNRDALSQMAELEQLYYGSRINILAVRKKCDELLASLRQLVESLDGLGRGRYHELQSACHRVEQELALLFHSGPCCLIGDLVLPLEALRPETVQEAGGKATNLATIARFVKLPIPPGFAITSYAFERFLEENKLAVPMEMILTSLNPDDPVDLEVQSAIIQKSIQNAPVPDFLAEKIFQAYEVLESKTHKNVRIAMRSSAVGEDTEASFAGQHLTVLNVTQENILEAYKAVVASKYSPRAILYRLNFGLDDRETPMCVAGIAMLDSQASGVLYTVDPTRPDSGLLKISSIWGLGEHLVSGEASPDEFYVDKSRGAITQPGHRSEKRETHQSARRRHPVGGGAGRGERPIFSQRCPGSHPGQIRHEIGRLFPNAPGRGMGRGPAGEAFYPPEPAPRVGASLDPNQPLPTLTSRRIPFSCPRAIPPPRGLPWAPSVSPPAGR